MVMRVKLKNQGQKKEKSKPAASAKPSGAQKTRLKPKAAARRKGESTQAGTIFGASSGHGSLQK
jgi:hypothetical protein